MTKQTESKERKRRTDAVREQHLAMAKKLLDMKVPPYAVALQLQTKFDLSRSTAWRDVRHANDERSSQKDGGIQSTPELMDMRDSLISILYQSVLTASCEGDGKNLPRLTKEIRELMKVGGPGAGRHPNDGPPNLDDVVTQIQYLYQKAEKQS